VNDCLAIYLDESGDLGFNFENKGTPRYFIITLLVCNNKIAITQFKSAVKRTLKNKLKTKKSDCRELKGSDTTLIAKKYFYQHVAQSKDWYLYGIVLDKHKLKSKIESLPKEHRIYNYLSKEVLKQVDLTRIKSSLLLVVDKRKGKRGINEFNKYLSYHLEAMLPLNVTYDISHEQSHENSILQAVDMFCWGIRRYYEHKDSTWISVYEKKLRLVEVDDFLGIKKDGP
jgi:hypothetical protein